MALPVYSTRFLVVQGLNGVTATITVPTGHTYVVKQLTFYANPTLVTVRAFFRDLVSGATLFSAGTPAGTPAWYGFYGAIVFPAGATFRWEASGGPVDGADLSASGYDLTTS